MALQDKRIVWSPLRRHKFLVGGGSQLTLYDWSPDDSSVRHVASQQDLQLMKVVTLGLHLLFPVCLRRHSVLRLVSGPSNR